MVYLSFCHINTSHMTFLTNQLAHHKAVAPTSTPKVKHFHSLKFGGNHQPTAIVSGSDEIKWADSRENMSLGFTTR